MRSARLTPRKQILASFFDGLCGAVIGVIAVIAFQIAKPAVQGTERERATPSLDRRIAYAAQSGIAAVLYLVALAVLYRFTNKWVPPALVIVGAIAGQFLFVDQPGQ